MAAVSVIVSVASCGDDGSPSSGGSEASDDDASESMSASAPTDDTQGTTSPADTTTDPSETTGDTSDDTTDTGEPADGVRMLYARDEFDVGNALYFVSFDDGAVTPELQLTQPSLNFPIQDLELLPDPRLVKFSQLTDGFRVRFAQFTDGVPSVVEPDLDPRAESFLADAARDGSGVILSVRALGASPPTYHHLSFDGVEVGAPVQLFGTFVADPLVEDVAYVGVDRVALAGDVESDADDRNLFVVAVDDPLVLHTLDPEGSSIELVTPDDVVVYGRSGSPGSFAVALDGVEVADTVELGASFVDGADDPSVSPDGGVLAYYADDPEALFVSTLDGVAEGAPSLAVEAANTEDPVEWSPDGAWLICPVADGWAIAHVADAVPGEPLVLPYSQRVFLPDSSALLLLPTDSSDFVDLLVVELDGDAASEPYTLADVATYGEIEGAWASSTGEVAFAARPGDGGSLWYVPALTADATPIELTAGPSPGDSVTHAWFSPDGTHVVANRDGRLIAIALARPGIEVEIAGPGVRETLLVP